MDHGAYRFEKPSKNLVAGKWNLPYCKYKCGLLEIDQFNKRRKFVKVFLGGTCHNSNWREKLIPLLKENGINYFNPVVEDWTPECMKEEIKQRQECDICLYVISYIESVFSIAEVVDDANNRPNKTALVILPEFFNKYQMKHLNQIAMMVASKGCFVSDNLKDFVEWVKTKEK